MSEASEGVLQSMWGPNGWDHEVNPFQNFADKFSETCFPISFRCQSGSLQLNSQTARMLPSLLIKYDSKIIMVDGHQCHHPKRKYTHLMTVHGKCKELVSAVVTLDVGL